MKIIYEETGEDVSDMFEIEKENGRMVAHAKQEFLDILNRKLSEETK